MAFEDVFKEWLEEAKEDLDVARELLRGGHWRRACFFAQQSTEKLLKALLIKKGVFIPTHNLRRLVELVEKEYGVKILNRAVTRNELDKLTAHYILARYAPPLPGTPDYRRWTELRRRYGISRYDERLAREALDVTERLWTWAKRAGLI